MIEIIGDQTTTSCTALSTTYVIVVK